MTERAPQPTIVTEVAIERGDDHRFRGHGVFSELAGAATFTELLVLALTGRRLLPEETRVVDDVAGVMAVADPRVWPLKIARLVATSGGFVSGWCAGQLCLEGARVGPWNCGAAAELLTELRVAVGALEAAGVARPLAVAQAVRERLASGGPLAGFGVPIRPVDERVEALARLLESRRRAHLPHFALLRELEGVTRSARGFGPNIGAGAAACLLDLGFTPGEIAPLATVLTTETFVANAWEGAGQRSALLARLPPECVRYEGREPRRSPRATPTTDRSPPRR